MALMFPEFEIERIDFFRINGFIRVNKMSKFASDPSELPRWRINETIDHTDKTLDEMLDWLRENGWTIRTWTTGARAFKHGLTPVRSRGEILRLRDKLKAYPPPGVQVHTLDLAYDF